MSVQCSRRRGQKLPKILVVDDHRSLALALTAGLERAGFRVRMAGSVGEALARLKEETFDAVVSDVEMPQLSGVYLAEEIRQRFPTTRVVMMSGFGRPPELAHLPFLPKPFAIETLIGILGAMGGEERTNRERVPGTFQL